MSLTVKDIEDLLSIEGGGNARGVAVFHKMKDKRDHHLTPAQRELVEEVLARKPERVTVPQHPEDVAKHQTRGDAGLSAIELVWLQRLPHDPARITFDDATQLAAMAASIKATESPASARLIQSVWGPVKALHDQRVARAEVQRAEVVTTAPRTAESALSDAVQENYPDLSEEGRSAETVRLADDINQRFAHRHQSNLAGARRSLEDATEQVQRYSQTERDTVA